MMRDKRNMIAIIVAAALFIGGCSPAIHEAASPTANQPSQSSSATEPAASVDSKKKKKDNKGKPSKPKEPNTATPSGDAASTLATLPVKGRAPKTGYDRNSFGPAWKDVDRNKCDTRNDILARDLVERQMQGSCIVLSGVLYPDPYTATNITFVRGKSLVDIDHVVALGNAWVTGAFQWDTPKKEAFANDPLNLLAVSASANRQKSDADAATWLPSNRPYRCAYVARQIAVKSKYGLWITSAEKDAMVNTLSACPGEPLPTNSNLPAPVPVGPPSPETSSPPQDEPGAVKRYANCTEARSAGVAPIRKVDSPDLYELNIHLDRDRDGVACQ